MLESANHNTLDALLPREMAEKAEQVGVEKTRFDSTSLLALAVLAGAFVAFDRYSRSWSRPAPTASCPMA